MAMKQLMLLKNIKKYHKENANVKMILTNKKVENNNLFRNIAK